MYTRVSRIASALFCDSNGGCVRVRGFSCPCRGFAPTLRSRNAPSKIGAWALPVESSGTEWTGTLASRVRRVRCTQHQTIHHSSRQCNAGRHPIMQQHSGNEASPPFPLQRGNACMRAVIRPVHRRRARSVCTGRTEPDRSVRHRTKVVGHGHGTKKRRPSSALDLVAHRRPLAGSAVAADAVYGNAAGDGTTTAEPVEAEGSLVPFVWCEGDRLEGQEIKGLRKTTRKEGMAGWLVGLRGISRHHEWLDRFPCDSMQAADPHDTCGRDAASAIIDLSQTDLDLELDLLSASIVY